MHACLGQNGRRIKTHHIDFHWLLSRLTQDNCETRYQKWTGITRCPGRCVCELSRLVLVDTYAVKLHSRFYTPGRARWRPKGDLPSNWQFFHDQWKDWNSHCKVLDEKDNVIKVVATLWTVMGKVWIWRQMTPKFRRSACLQSLKEYFELKRNEIYERYIFYTCDQGPEGASGYMGNTTAATNKTVQFRSSRSTGHDGQIRPPDPHLTIEMSECYPSLTAHQHQKGHTVPNVSDIKV